MPVVPGRTIVVLLGVLLLAAPRLAALDALPTLEEALAQDVHGKYLLRKNKLTVEYRFQKSSERDDFGGQTTLDFGSKQPQLRDDGSSPGARLGFRPESLVTVKIPFAQLETVEFGVSGVNDLDLTLAAASGEIRIQIGKLTRVTSSVGGAGKTRKVPLDPGATYKVGILRRKDKLTVTLNGKKVISEKLDKEQPPTSGFAFKANIGTAPILEFFAASGIIDEALPLIVVNRRGLMSGKLPLWPQRFESQGERFKVVSPESEEKAAFWVQRLEKTYARIIKDFPELADSDYKRDVYVFGRNAVGRSYGISDVSGALPDKSIAFLGEGAGPSFNAGMLAMDVMSDACRSAPLWIKSGCRQYYAQCELTDDGVSLGFSKDRAERARALADKLTPESLATLLDHKYSSEENPRPLYWALVRFFLESAGPGSDRFFRRYVSALSQRASGLEALKYALKDAPAKLADICAEFKEHAGTSLSPDRAPLGHP